MVSADGQVAGVGLEFLILGPDGRIRRDYQFTRAECIDIAARMKHGEDETLMTPCGAQWPGMSAARRTRR
jgi:hypothetical protein